jgi:biotin carboxyl carrier protein
MDYKVSLQDHSFQITQKDQTLYINEIPVQADISQPRNGVFHIIYRHKTYTIELLEKEEGGQSLVMKVNGKKCTAKVQNKFDLLLEKMGLSLERENTLSHIKAPMPGLILNIMASEGQAVKKGDPLLILEAMKMENIIKSPGDGTIAAIKAKKGDSVEKNQLLIEFE